MRFLPSTRALLLSLTLSWAYAAVPAAAAELARADYGATHLPIWSALSYFERDALSKLPRARNDEPDALLALYLVASNVRDLATYETANRRIHAFVAGLKDQVRDPNNTRFVGELLNRQMHSQFFLQDGDGKAPSGYDADQSRLAGIFETGVYNCISSALLYAVLARHFGLDMQGVLLPSHAFIQVNSPDGAIDVETTSPAGFGEQHTEAFYARQSAQWHQVRDLPAVTYEDYLNRTRVSLTALAAKNMLNQHTATGLMPYSDGARLAEISAYIQPRDSLAQEKRLHFYNNELHRLATNNHWDTLKRLFATTYASVVNDAGQLGAYAPLTEPLLYFQLGALRTHAHNADEPAALAVLDDLLREHPVLPNQQADIETDIAGSMHVLAGQLVAQGHFEQALALVPTLTARLPAYSDWNNITRFVYLKWVAQFWDAKQWQEVIYVATDWWEEPGLTGDDKAFEVLSLAHHNLVLEALNNGEQTTANAHIELCEVSLPAEVCAGAKALLQKPPR